MKKYNILITFLMLLNLSSCSGSDKYHEYEYSEIGVVRKVSDSLPWNRTFAPPTYEGTNIAFERDFPKGEMVAIVVWGHPPVWESLHCKITIFHGCINNYCGDFVNKVERLD